ncbi:hypothetical protein BC941DRAFT_408246 [Chlamydoabsidia padenii]|nr:hypothetical protein BC941DRAFT_408246 [Chlamydoabsidia padenii]
MCRRITCSKCEKYTWTGCGLHVQTALAGLSEDEICQCNKQDASKDATQDNVAKQ